jgi:hypothetical protein
MRQITSHINAPLPTWRLRRAFLTWLCLLCLFLNVLGGALLSRPDSAKLLGEANGLYQICTAGGLIEIDADGKRAPAESTGHGSDICIFCLPLVHGGIDAPTLFVVADAELLASGAIFPEAPSQAPALIHTSGASGPRAPPIL